MACCFSNFKQLFAQGQEFTYGIEDIARYYPKAARHRIAARIDNLGIGQDQMN